MVQRIHQPHLTPEYSTCMEGVIKIPIPMTLWGGIPQIVIPSLPDGQRFNLLKIDIKAMTLFPTSDVEAIVGDFSLVNHSLHAKLNPGVDCSYGSQELGKGIMLDNLTDMQIVFIDCAGVEIHDPFLFSGSIYYQICPDPCGNTIIIEGGDPCVGYNNPFSQGYFDYTFPNGTPSGDYEVIPAPPSGFTYIISRIEMYIPGYWLHQGGNGVMFEFFGTDGVWSNPIFARLGSHADGDLRLYHSRKQWGVYPGIATGDTKALNCIVKNCCTPSWVSTATLRIYGCMEEITNLAPLPGCLMTPRTCEYHEVVIPQGGLTADMTVGPAPGFQFTYLGYNAIYATYAEQANCCLVFPPNSPTFEPYLRLDNQPPDPTDPYFTSDESLNDTGINIHSFPGIGRTFPQRIVSPVFAPAAGAAIVVIIYYLLQPETLPCPFFAPALGMKALEPDNTLPDKKPEI